MVGVANEFSKAIRIPGNQAKISVEAKNATKKQHKDAYEETSQHGRTYIDNKQKRRDTIKN